MRNYYIILFLLMPVLFTTAQNKKPPVYYYTAASENYFTDAEIDSLIYRTSAAIFKENMIPEALFEKKYPLIKNIIAINSKKNIIQSFRLLESGILKNANTEKGSDQYNDNKQLYLKNFEKQIKATFKNNGVLSQYLTFNASDHITFFNSTVKVEPGGKLLVTEKISVYNGDGQLNPLYGDDSSLQQSGAMNNEIKRGIVRAFPLYYVNKYKLFQNTTFNIKEVLRDGNKENYHTEKQGNGILLYTGSSNIFLNKGNYTYSITYETDHQLKFLKDYDELYWNVTGNGWSFRIDAAACTVILPKNAATLSSKCYTGSLGSIDEDCDIFNDTFGDNTIIVFKTSQPLLPNQGFTIATSWPKGIVTAPGTWQQIKYYFWNNKAVFFLPFAALFSAIFCFIFWLQYGRDPHKGVVYPQFEPPAGYSPAALGYIYYQKFDRQLTAATIVDAAVRNKIKVSVEREGLIFKHNEYKISENKDPVKPAVSKYEDFESGVEDLIDTTIKKGKYNSDLGSLNTRVQEFCEKNYKNKDGVVRKGYRGFFALNSSYTIIPGLICTIASCWGLYEVILAFIRHNLWQFVYYIAGIILCYLVFKIFYSLLRAYSIEGRKIADKIAGFRLFLSTADEKRFDTMTPPKNSLNLYEKYLPFAIALGCEIEWGKKFEDIINTAYLNDSAASSLSQSFTHDSKNFTSTFASSFSGAISSASSPPSSSSGGGSSFGGGSSGGGGGGGGGGGW